MSGTTNPDPPETRNDPEAGSSAGKRAYVKPTFRRELVFETMALACGKISSTQAQCGRNTKSS